MRDSVWKSAAEAAQEELKVERKENDDLQEELSRERARITQLSLYIVKYAAQIKALGGDPDPPDDFILNLGSDQK